MHEMGNRYLEDLRRELRRLHTDEREDAVREIGSHIAEAEAAGRPLTEVLSRLGPPKTLARAFIADSYLQESATGPRGLRLMKMTAFVASSGLLSLCIVPLLVVTVATFGVSAIVMPVFGGLQLAGVIPDSSGVLYWGQPVARVWVLPLTLAVTVLCGGLAWFAWRALRWYAVHVSAGYRRVLAALPNGA
jgi:uncharacterized membrane protein